ncbi:hypothetical protein VDGD_20362 [Verticillium dahliae]|nr:hypothetical protein VDGD_20362 [Verticillium dahliae]
MFPASTGTTIFSDGVLRSSRLPPTPPPSNVSSAKSGPPTPEPSVSSAVVEAGAESTHRRPDSAPGGLINHPAQRLSLGAVGSTVWGIQMEGSTTSQRHQTKVERWLGNLYCEGKDSQYDNDSRHREEFSLSKLVLEADKLVQLVFVSVARPAKTVC